MNSMNTILWSLSVDIPKERYHNEVFISMSGVYGSSSSYVVISAYAWYKKSGDKWPES